MADTLVGNLTGGYYRNSSILTGRPRLVKVVVEDEFDVPFWYDVLSSMRTDKEFNVVPYSYASEGEEIVLSLNKGKEHILSKVRAHELNAFYIGCVDSDYDFLLKRYRDVGMLMEENPYLLQTYAYSIENLLCYADTLKALCIKAVHEIPNFDFEDYMQGVSRIIRPLLIRALYLESQGYEDFTATEWKYVFPCDDHNCSNETDKEKILGKLQHNVNAVIQRIEATHPEIAEEIGTFEEAILEDAGELVSEVYAEQCYLMARGHDVYRFVLNTALKGVTQQLKNQHIASLKSADAKDADKVNRINQYRKNITNVEILLGTNYEYKHNCPLYELIRRDVERIGW